MGEGINSHHKKEGAYLNNFDYTFLRYPRALFTNPVFASISIEARTLLALILDRLELSQSNSERFSDENGNVYVIYTVEEICKKFGCGNKKVTKLFRELEASEMIYRRRTNGSRPSKIYLTKNFFNALKKDFAKCINKPLQNVETALCKASKTPSINNEYNNNNNINNNSSIIVTDDEIKEMIEYDCFYCEEYAGVLDELVMIISDVFNGTSSTVRIGKDDIPRSIVVSRFRMIDSDDILSILWQLNRNTVKIRNMKAYLIMMLYNEIETKESGLAALEAKLKADFG